MGTNANPAATPLWKVGHNKQCGGVSPLAPPPLAPPNVTVLERGGGPRPDTHSLGGAKGSVGEQGRLRRLTIPL